ncbi:MAG: glycosyltransferase [Anaerolineae bacterium]
MRVVHMIRSFGIAGAEQHLLRLLPGLAERGLDVRLALLEEPRYPMDVYCSLMAERGIPVDRIPYRGHVNPPAFFQIVRYLRRIRPDLLHTHLIHADVFGQLAGRLAGVPLAVSSRHGANEFLRSLLIPRLARAVTSSAQRVICISDGVAQFVREVDRFKPDRVRVIHYGIETPVSTLTREEARAALGIDHQGPLAGAFGRLIPVKGHDVLLDAFARAVARHPDARLVIVGDGPLRDDLQAQAERLGVGGSVYFAGWIDNAHRLMPACDLVVIPSRSEGFGLVTLEAMGCSLPVIATRVMALPEIVVDGETGLLVPPDDPAALAAALDSLLGDPARAAAYGQAGYRRLLSSFTVEKMVDATAALYNEIIGAAAEVS